MKPFESLNDIEQFVVQNLRQTTAAFSAIAIGQDGEQVRLLIVIEKDANNDILDLVLKQLGIHCEKIKIEVFPYGVPEVGEILPLLQDYYNEKNYPAPSVAELEALWNK